MSQDRSLIRALLSHGAKPVPSDPGYNALIMMLQLLGGDNETVALLLEHGAQPVIEGRLTPLNWAVVLERRNVAQILLAHGADVNATTTEGMTGLHQAASRHDLLMLDFLLSHHASINAQDNMGRTPLMYTVKARPMREVAETVRLLLQQGADGSLRDKRGYTAFDLAKSMPEASEKRVVMRLLMGAGAIEGAKH